MKWQSSDWNSVKFFQKLLLIKGSKTYGSSLIYRAKSIGCFPILLCHPAWNCYYSHCPLEREEVSSLWTLSFQSKLLPAEGQSNCVSASRSGWGFAVRHLCQSFSSLFSQRKFFMVKASVFQWALLPCWISHDANASYGESNWNPEDKTGKHQTVIILSLLNWPVSHWKSRGKEVADQTL